MLAALAFALPVSTALSAVLALVFVVCVSAGAAVGAWPAAWRRWAGHPVVLASVAMYGVVLAGVAWSGAPMADVTRQLVRSLPWLLMPLFLVVLDGSPWPRRCLHAWSAALVLTLGLSYAHAAWAWAGLGHWPLPYAGGEQARGGEAIFHVHITHNVLMSLGVLWWLGRALWQHNATPLRRAVWVALALAGMANIVWMVPGRTGYFTLLGVLLVLTVQACPRRWLTPALAGVLLACVAALSLSGGARQQLERTWREIQTFRHAGQGPVGDINLSDYRPAIWAQAVHVAAQHPWVGQGTGSYRQAFCATAQPADLCAYGGGKHPHNQMLFIVIEAGALGLSAYLAWLVVLARAGWRQPQGSLPRHLMPGVLVVWLVYGMVDTPMMPLIERHLFVLLLALFVVPWSSAESVVAPHSDRR